MSNTVAIVKMCINTMMAGAAIALGAYAYLSNIGWGGALLFCVGLIAVLHHKLFLFTGRIYAISSWMDLYGLFGILAFNILGVWAMSFMVYNPYIISQCQQIVEQRSSMGFGCGLINGAGCGFLVTLAVYSWEKTKLPLVLAVPAFIMTGFTHSIADAFYYIVGWDSVNAAALMTYAGTILGNFLGGYSIKLGAFKNIG